MGSENVLNTEGHDPRVCGGMHRAMELIGRRWTGVIVFVMTQGPKRFGDFREAIPALSDRMLSERLKELEAEGLVRREVSSDRPVQVRYQLTPIGAALAPVFAAIGEWAAAWAQSQGLASGPASVDACTPSDALGACTAEAGSKPA